MERQLLIAALKAKLIEKEAELEMRAGYVYNKDFQLECSVLNHVIASLREHIAKLEREALNGN